MKKDASYVLEKDCNFDPCPSQCWCCGVRALGIGSMCDVLCRGVCSCGWCACIFLLKMVFDTVNSGEKGGGRGHLPQLVTATGDGELECLFFSRRLKR